MSSTENEITNKYICKCGHSESDISNMINHLDQKNKCGIYQNNEINDILHICNYCTDTYENKIQHELECEDKIYVEKNNIQLNYNINQYYNESKDNYKLITAKNRLINLKNFIILSEHKREKLNIENNDATKLIHSMFNKFEYKFNQLN